MTRAFVEPDKRSKHLVACLICLVATLVAGCVAVKSGRVQEPPRSAFGSSAPSAAESAPRPTLKDLQGAWWSDPGNPTADFGIAGEEVWLDADAGYHPCRILGDTLVFSLGGDAGDARSRIVRLAGDTLLLESVATGDRQVLIRSR